VPLSRSDVITRWRDQITHQDYSQKPAIDGVRFVELKRFLDDGGSFAELGRLEGGQLAAAPGFIVRQVSYSTMQPGAVKAFHLHFSQNEFWFVPPESRLLIGLVDARERSPSASVSMRFVLGDGQARLLYIPAGVAHGAANLTGMTGQIVYFMDQQFSPDPDKTDEQRLPWNLLGEDFWRMERG
jgi:dTDP-4-dehydrorhamnose 3,5-epimerase